MTRSISLIIPCFRDSATLGRAINSVLLQTRPVDEIIVVNDCSPETAEIKQVLSAFPQVVYVENTINMGLAASRNMGAQKASGSVLTFLDADDELHPRKIELQLKFVRENTAVTTQVRIIHPGTNASGFDFNNTFPRVKVVKRVARMLLGNRLTGASMMIYAEHFRKLNGYDVRLKSCEDYDLWLRLLEGGGQVVKLMQPLYLYYFNPQGLSKNYLNISYWELEVIRGYFSRHGLVLGNSLKAGLIWAVWMLRHLLRCEMAQHSELKLKTLQNINMLSGQKILMGLLMAIDKLRLMKLCSIIIRLKTI